VAIVPMQRIYICALKKDRKRILEFLQRKEVVEIREMLSEDNIFKRMDTAASVASLNKNVTTAKEALAILNKYSPEKSSPLSMFAGRNEISYEQYGEFYAKHENTVKIANRISEVPKQIAELKAEIIKLKTQKELLRPWVNLDIPFNFTGTKHTAAFIGTLPTGIDIEGIYSALADNMPVDVDIISTTKEQTSIFVICEKKKSEEVYNSLRNIGFSHVQSSSSKVPSEQIRIIDEEIAKAESEIVKIEEAMKAYDEYREDIRFLQDFDTMRASKYEVLNHIYQSNNVIMITGYVPENTSSKLKFELEKDFDAAIDFEEPSEEEDVPVLLKNKGFAAPVEGIIDSFSLPGKGEVDPTTAVSIFYYMLFGLMLSDAAYGAIIAFACGFLLLKFRRTMDYSWKNTLKMYFYCGLATIFWGVMFGSYFGDIVDVASATFLGKKVTIPPLWFFPVKEPMRMLVFSMALGIIHLFAALGMKMIQCIKNKDFKAIIYDVVFWYLLLTGSVMVLLSMEMFIDIVQLNFILPESAGNVGGVLAIIGSAGIVLTNGRESRNPFKRFLKGLYALYGITGYLSDVLSYSRLLALGLATGVICSVINQMAGMAAGSIGGAAGIIVFVIVCILGHLLNIAINALGAYVHTNRLHYVEFFSKFYEGGGRKFQPFGIKTKYYKIMEE
jgi:V/A-type H+-transporting ATPase subunit I